ncbi:MAG: Rrf2 family transcriptional regulator [Candidatus Bipolaricaulaceae bacterium]
MWLSRRVSCGLRLLVLIAKEPERLQSARPLAEREGLPETFVRQILLRLRKAGFLEAERGRQGGYKLARPPEKIRIAAVLRALEEDLGLYLAGKRGRGLRSPGKDDFTAPFWDRMEKKFWELLEEASLADLL